VLIGIGQSGVTYSVVSGVLGRRFAPEKRSMVLGISRGRGSFGQFAMLPLTQWMLTHIGWHGASTGPRVRRPFSSLHWRGDGRARRDRRRPSSNRAQQAASEAFSHRGYVLLTRGFFVCGFQVVFVGVHLPSYLADRGLAPHVAVTALALVGLFNIVGTYTRGWLGGRMSKKYILSFIYFARAVGVRRLLLDAASPRSAFTRLRYHRPCGCRRFPPRTHSSPRSSACAISRCCPGFTFLLAPGGQLPRALAGRQAIRHHRQLRYRVVSRDGAWDCRRPPQSADRRAPVRRPRRTAA
jgi:hypothetical protein